MKENYTIDASDFEKKFGKLVVANPNWISDGIFKAASTLLEDADNIPPKTPLKEGHLKASKKIEKPIRHDGAISIRLGYNKKYAARLHEMEKKGVWTEPGSGPKYVLSKMTKYMKKYVDIIAETIRRKMK